MAEPVETRLGIETSGRRHASCREGVVLRFAFLTRHVAKQKERPPFRQESG